uniref:Uncharacterized protein n=1 Tax=Nelumbo nucifera TaxID=4432 RepID=A0A822XH20_NELNU|nr:TPA_asm: hypothetical protein HUJ06_021144 [Nelumbo nucifera]
MSMSLPCSDNLFHQRSRVAVNQVDQLEDND